MARSTSRWMMLTSVAVGLALGVGYWRRRMSYDLRGRTVLITGGSRGLGLELARQFAARGSRLVLAARDIEELEGARVEIERRGGHVLVLPCDLTDPDDIESLVERATAHFGAVEVLVNNAGRIDVGPLETMSVHEFEAAMALHFFAPLRTMLAVLPGMRARRSGRIVNISSIGGIIAAPHLVTYTASKFALRGLSEGMGAELERDGIVVTTVCPGLMRTGSPRKAMFKGQQAKEYAWFATADVAPLMSMNSTRAAARIVTAVERGERHLVMPWTAKIAAVLQGVAPSAVRALLGLVNRLLPEPVAETGAAPGSELESAPPRWVSRRNERAGTRNHEFGGRGNGRGHS